jgi:hypothetical protein
MIAFVIVSGPCVLALTPLALPLLGPARDALPPHSSRPDHSGELLGGGLAPERRVEDAVRDRLYGPHMRWNVEPAVRRQASSTILPSFPPASNRS